MLGCGTRRLLGRIVLHEETAVVLHGVANWKRRCLLRVSPVRPGLQRFRNAKLVRRFRLILSSKYERCNSLMKKLPFKARLR